MFRPETGEVTCEQGNVHQEKPYDLYSSSRSVMNCRPRTRWCRHGRNINFWYGTLLVSML